MSVPTTAKGYGISGESLSSLLPPQPLTTDTEKYTDFTVKDFKLKTPGPHDVTIKIDYCGKYLLPQQ